MLIDKIEKNCLVCGGGRGNFFESVCSFCEGSGLNTKYGAALMSHHICFCALNDGKICPICKFICHHKPKLLIEKL